MSEASAAAIIIGKDPSTVRSLSGPPAVFEGLLGGFKQTQGNFELLTYHSGLTRKLVFAARIVYRILKCVDKVIYASGESYALAILILVLSKINSSNSYYLTIHGLTAMQIRYNSRTFLLTRLVERIVIKNFPNLVCVSTYLKESINELFGRSYHVFVVNNGVSIVETMFNEAKDSSFTVKLVSANGVSRLRGTYELIDVVEFLNAELDKKVYLDIYGEDGTSEFHDFLRSRKLDRYVSYRGYVKDKSLLFQKYEEADLNVCISLFDTFNTSVLESMVVGTPTIVSDRTGASELISNYQNGFVVSIGPYLKYEILEVIRFMLDQPEEFRNVRKNAFREARKHSWSLVANDYMNLFKSCS